MVIWRVSPAPTRRLGAGTQTHQPPARQNERRILELSETAAAAAWLWQSPPIR